MLAVSGVSWSNAVAMRPRQPSARSCLGQPTLVLLNRHFEGRDFLTQRRCPSHFLTAADPSEYVRCRSRTSSEYPQLHRHLEATMPARIIGMIGVAPPKQDSTLLVIEGEISPPFVVEFAQAHEAAGFDMVLVGYSSSSAEGFLVAMHAAGRTERMSYLVAHRPGFVAPTLFARKVATFDQLTGGRLALHIITGKTDAEQEGDGDFTPKAERYERAQEYLHLMKRTLDRRQAFRFCRSLLPGPRRPFRCASTAETTSADHVRRRLRGRTCNGFSRVRRVCYLRRAARYHRGAHGCIPSPCRKA